MPQAPDERCDAQACQRRATIGRVSVENEVLEAASVRAAALGRGDPAALRSLLHARFVWTSHTGESFDRESYSASNTEGPNHWHGQHLEGTEVVAVGDVAILRCVGTDDVDAGKGRRQYRMPMTQTWIRAAGRWQLLAGHAGPRVNSAARSSASAD
jgi:hypothetical protein